MFNCNRFAELDPARHARALVRLSQQEMAWEGVA
jgi:hypothetical protein